MKRRNQTGFQPRNVMIWPCGWLSLYFATPGYWDESKEVAVSITCWLCLTGEGTLLKRLWHIYCTDFGISLLSRVEWFLFLKWFATPSVTWCVKSQGFGSSTFAATMPYLQYLFDSFHISSVCCVQVDPKSPALFPHWDIQNSVGWLVALADWTQQGQSDLGLWLTP